MKSSSFSRLVNTQAVLSEENSRLSSELGSGTTTHSFMHYPWTATTAPQLILEPDKDEERSRQAVQRVVAAYQAALQEKVQPAPSMWDGIENQSQNFIDALNKGNAARAQQHLSRLFQSSLIWGLGKYDQPLVDDMRRVPDRSHVQLRITDALVSLGQAVGSHALTSVEQSGVLANINALNIDIEKTLYYLETTAQMDVSSPRVGAAYGCEVGGRFITIDGLLHSYTVHRIKQLGASADTKVVEIGGGFGCLAHLMGRAGLKQYAIYDLPWVNAIQGYYLLMCLPPEMVRLHGESSGTVEVNPFWRFEELADRSVEYLVNTDSLPEMGRQTAMNYIQRIKRVLKGQFLSINQEAKADNAGVGQQNSVSELVRETGGLKRLSRALYWMRQGYVEEVYRPE